MFYGESHLIYFNAGDTGGADSSNNPETKPGQTNERKRGLTEVERAIGRPHNPTRLTPPPKIKTEPDTKE